MTKIIGKIESLKALRKELKDRNINIFNSVADINKFQREYKNYLNDILKKTEYVIFQEIHEHKTKIDYKENRIKDLPPLLKHDIKKIGEEINLLNNKKTNFITKYFVKYKLKEKESKRKHYKVNFDSIITNKEQLIKREINYHYAKISYLNDNKEKEIKKRSTKKIKDLNYIRDTIGDLYPLIAGALGENLVVKELSKLSNNYFLFNDFQLNFNPPIYNKQSADRIYSIQIDHLLVAPSGIFLLETKNWSKKSIESFDFRSPVDQILRTSYALFVFLNSSKVEMLINKHHWGKKKIPIKNLLVMINNKPKNEFKYLKVLNLQELNRYIEYFDPVFEKEEVNSIANYLESHKK